MDFEWDPAKAEVNKRKHNIDFRVATLVFDDPFQFEYDDHTRRDELRHNVVGMVDGRLVVVTYTVRGDA